MAPHFKHGCEGCHFVGHYHDVKKTQDYDLYVCSGEPTVVARYSDAGPHFVNGIEFVGSNRAITAAWSVTQRLNKAGELPADVAALVPVIRQHLANHRAWKRGGWTGDSE